MPSVKIGFGIGTWHRFFFSYTGVVQRNIVTWTVVAQIMLLIKDWICHASEGPFQRRSMPLLAGWTRWDYHQSSSESLMLHRNTSRRDFDLSIYNCQEGCLKKLRLASRMMTSKSSDRWQIAPCWKSLDTEFGHDPLIELRAIVSRHFISYQAITRTFRWMHFRIESTNERSTTSTAPCCKHQTVYIMG